MSRTTLTGPQFQPFYAVELLLDSGPLRFWTGYDTKTIGGQTYNGIGGLLSISGIEEVTDLSAKSATVTLNGIESTSLGVAFTEPVQYRVCNIYFGLRDTGTVDQVFGGQVNTVDISDDGQTGTIQISVDSIYITLDRIRPRRYTSESQKSRYSSDTFFDWVSKLQDKQVVWGRSEDS